MGLETLAAIGIGSAIAGTGSSMFGASQDAKNQKKRSSQLTNQANSMMQNTPGGAESALMDFLRTISSNAGINSGQDALMQQLRADPSKQQTYVDDTIRGVATRADPFAAGGSYENLDRLNQLDTRRQVAGLRGSASSVGGRFGSNAATAESTLREGLATQQGAQRATLAEQFQNLRLQAAALGNARESSARDARIQAATASGQLGLGQIGALLQALMGAGGLEQGRRNTNAQLFGASAGIPQAASPWGAVGSGLTDIGSLLAVIGSMGKKKGA